jgi:hypothetical protein
MSEDEWYGSEEHFNTEMDYEDYKKSRKKARKLTAKSYANQLNKILGI